MDDGVFQFYQARLIRKVLENTGMEHRFWFPTPTKVEAPLGTYDNGYEAKIYFPDSYVSVIGMMLYLASNTIPDIFFAVQQCAQFTHKTKASQMTYLKSICWYLQGTKYNALVFNSPKKLVVDCYADAYFTGLWGHEIIKTLFVILVEI